MRKIFVWILLSWCFVTLSAYSGESHIIDFTKVLNESKAGKEAQEFLKNKLNKDIKRFSDIENNLREEEKQLISQKKVISQEEYQKKVDDLRNKVSKLQSDRNTSLNNVAKTRAEARTKLLSALNPILEEYMEKNNVNLILDKSSILVSKKELDITDQIIEVLNKNLKSLNLK